jgi:hypothetical protein
LILNLLPQPNP